MNVEQLIEEEHERLGINPNIENKNPTELPTAKVHDGMRFFVDVNEAEEGGSTTVHVIYGTWSRRENKRSLRKYLTALGYKSHSEHKTILKALGFWSKKQLGTIA